ncbi:DUF6398 domain-containing protein [Jiangella alkaliphila]|uniref:DUF6398 domain-containing protein n=1 Tax=Jiangella alkaliphila TaxID=419479 RepID=A0A1H2L351_9ACTN|nr:DUF6398 domain-containing protein [Jiangella alkaliphila]SDU75487.1 hypothetical protein SAMN04488563_4978 [Jiangella alkaliphila]
MTTPTTLPIALRPVVSEVSEITDAFCADHLDDDYAQLSRRLVETLARKRPSPLARGDRRIWAAGVVYTIGRVNFLSDPAQRPHLRTDELARLFGVKQATMGNKGRLIMDLLRIGVMDPQWTRHDMIEKNPMAWLVQLSNGFVVDARTLPQDLQEEAARLGLIPYVPGQA